MTEFEEIDGKLVRICQHEWGEWTQFYYENTRDYQVSNRYCAKCDKKEQKMLVPRGSSYYIGAQWVEKG